MMLTYFFALFVYFNYYDVYSYSGNKQVCLKLIDCYFFIFDFTFKTNGGFTSQKFYSEIETKVVFDFIYNFIVTILVN